MNLPRSLTIKVNTVLDHYLPPKMRDSKILFTALFSIVFKEHTKIFLTFKEKAAQISDKEFSEIYKKTAAVSMKRETDLNEESLGKVLSNIHGKTVLEVGCGRGYLANKIAATHKITACDIVIDEKTKKKYKNVTFKKANIEKLPFKNNSFDTVVTTHTLEHVLHIQEAITELRRVTKSRLIIVVPQQRPYKYTFDLHLHFFPYPFILSSVMGNKKNSSCERVEGDLIYIENFK